MFRVQGIGFRGQVPHQRLVRESAWGFGLGVRGLRLEAGSLGLRVQGAGCRV